MCLSTDELTYMNILIDVFSKLGPIERIWALSRLLSDHSKLGNKERTCKESKPDLNDFELIGCVLGYKILKNKGIICVSCSKLVYQ